MLFRSRQFRGEVDEFPQTLSYGEKIDALRRRYSDRLWFADMVTTCDRSVEASPGIRHAVYRSHADGKRSVILANFGDEPEKAHVGWTGGLLQVTPEAPDQVPFEGAVTISPRSAVVVMEA